MVRQSCLSGRRRAPFQRSDLPRRSCGRRLKNSGKGARITAGSCRPGTEPRDGPLVPDITIGAWQPPWNLRGKRRPLRCGDRSCWCRSGGCVYTAQGLEYDWNGAVLARICCRHAADGGRGDCVVLRAESCDGN
ncbi:DNA/RNA helicase domain-containing protein [Promicromonospora sukumoe]|uniref:DNA/RNA helicase domain-containing protein n=1 Tax=Promicromonospora sukumoe TaxID=88382 RepID=UPI003668B228